MQKITRHQKDCLVKLAKNPGKVLQPISNKVFKLTGTRATFMSGVIIALDCRGFIKPDSSIGHHFGLFCRRVTPEGIEAGKKYAEEHGE